MEKQIYSYDEAYEESLRYFQGDELAARVWVNKYAGLFRKYLRKVSGRYALENCK